MAGKLPSFSMFPGAEGKAWHAARYRALPGDLTQILDYECLNSKKKKKNVHEGLIPQVTFSLAFPVSGCQLPFSKKKKVFFKRFKFWKKKKKRRFYHEKESFFCVSAISDFRAKKCFSLRKKVFFIANSECGKSLHCFRLVFLCMQKMVHYSSLQTEDIESSREACPIKDMVCT